MEGHLLHWGLIEKDLAGSLSLHRLVQKEVHRCLNGDQKQLAFDQVTFLLYHAFPKQDNSPCLDKHWEQGHRLVDHIDMLSRHYLNTSLSPQIVPSLHYIRLLSNCTWYVLFVIIRLRKQCIDIIRLLYRKRQCINAQTMLAGLDACEKLKKQSQLDEIDAIYLYLLNTGAFNDGLRGSFDSQIMKLKQVLKIRKCVPTAPQEMASILYKLCLAYESAMQYPKAFKYREKSREACLLFPESDFRNMELKQRELTYSRLLLATGKPEEAKYLIPGLSQYFHSINNWYLIAQ